MTTALAGLSSFDLRFLELDVLARDRVVFAEGHLLGDVPRILLGHVEEAGVGGADELDLDRGRLGHDSLSKRGFRTKNKSGVPAAHMRAALCIVAGPVSRAGGWLDCKRVGGLYDVQ